MPGKATAHTVRFEEFVFDLARVSCGRVEEVALSPHLVSLLEALLETPASWSRASPSVPLWPADTFVDYDTASRWP